jgi:hypothetical protein
MPGRTVAEVGLGSGMTGTSSERRPELPRLRDTRRTHGIPLPPNAAGASPPNTAEKCSTTSSTSSRSSQTSSLPTGRSPFNPRDRRDRRIYIGEAHFSTTGLTGLPPRWVDRFGGPRDPVSLNRDPKLDCLLTPPLSSASVPVPVLRSPGPVRRNGPIDLALIVHRAGHPIKVRMVHDRVHVLNKARMPWAPSVSLGWSIGLMPTSHTSEPSEHAAKT